MKEANKLTDTLDRLMDACLEFMDKPIYFVDKWVRKILK